MQASVNYWVAHCIYICVYDVHFIKTPNCFSPGHTLAEQRHLLCGCRKIFFVQYCLIEAVHMKLQFEYVQSGFPALAFHELPLACEVTFETQNIIFREIVLKNHF